MVWIGVVVSDPRGYPLMAAPGLAFWDAFLDEMEMRGLAQHPELAPTDAVYRAIDDELARFGVVTDWDDDSDPLWFPSRELRAHFIMVWL